MFIDGDFSALISDSLSPLSESSRITCGLSANWAGGDITGGLDRTSSDESSLALIMVTKFSIGHDNGPYDFRGYKLKLNVLVTILQRSNFFLLFCNYFFQFHFQFLETFRVSRPRDLHLSE